MGKIGANLIAVVIASILMTSTCIAVETKRQLAEEAKPSAPAVEFVRACCNMPDAAGATSCYENLLPHAESFHENHIKIVIAATNILVTHLQSYLSELRHLNSTTTEYTLGGCIKFADVSSNLCKEWVAKLERLDATHNGRLDAVSLGYVQNWMNKVEYGYEECTMLTANIMNPGEVIPVESTLHPSIATILGLIKGIPIGE